MIVEILIDIYLLVSSISVHFRKFSRNEIKTSFGEEKKVFT